MKKLKELPGLKIGDQLAFPCDGPYAGEARSRNDAGLTKLEYFALHLMKGLLSGADRHSQVGDCQVWNYEHLSKISIQAADALLTELEKTNQ